MPIDVTMEQSDHTFQNYSYLICFGFKVHCSKVLLSKWEYPQYWEGGRGEQSQNKSQTEPSTRIPLLPKHFSRSWTTFQLIPGMSSAVQPHISAWLSYGLMCVLAALSIVGIHLQSLSSLPLIRNCVWEGWTLPQLYSTWQSQNHLIFLC